jgi:hypothetical protein
MLLWLKKVERGPLQSQGLESEGKKEKEEIVKAKDQIRKDMGHW